MSLPPVNIQFVAGGVNTVLTSIKSIESSFSKLQTQLVNLEKKASDKRIKLYEKEAEEKIKLDSKANNSYKSALDKDIQNLKSSLDKKLELHRDYNKQVKQLGDTLNRSQEKLNGRKPHDPFNRIAGQFMPSGAISSAFSTATGSKAAGGLGLGVAGGIGLAAGVGAVVASLYALKKGIDVVVDGISSAANEMVQGVIQIGGGFSISNSMVKAAKLQTEAYQAQFAGATKSEQIPAKEIMNWAKEQSKGTQFDPMDYVKGLRAYQGLTGKSKDFMANSELTGKMAAVSGSSFEDIAKLQAQVGLQYKDFGKEDLEKITLGMWQSGRSGAIEIKDAQDMAKVTTHGRKLTGGATAENVLKMVGLAQMTLPAAGKSPAEAATAVDRFMQKNIEHAGKIKALSGMNLFDKEGKLNLTDALLATQKISKNKLVDMYGIEGAKVSEAVTSVVEGKTGADAKAAIEEFLNAKGNMEDLNDAFKEVSNTVENRLKSVFNELSDSVGTRLLESLEGNIPKIKEFGDKLIESIPSLVAIFETLVAIVPAVGDSFLALTPIIGKLGSVILDILVGTKVIDKKDASKAKFEITKSMQTIEEQKKQREYEKSLSPEELKEYKAEQNRVKAEKDLNKKYEKELEKRAKQTGKTTKEIREEDIESGYYQPELYTSAQNKEDADKFNTQKANDQLLQTIENTTSMTESLSGVARDIVLFSANYLSLPGVLYNVFTSVSKLFEDSAKKQEAAAKKQETSIDKFDEAVDRYNGGSQGSSGNNSTSPSGR